MLCQKNVARLALLNFTFYFLLFSFYYMSNIYNTPLNNYIRTNLNGKKNKSIVIFIFFMSNYFFLYFIILILLLF